MLKSPVLDAEGLVVNVVLCHGGWTPPEGLQIGRPGGEIGDWWDGEKYVPMDRRVKGLPPPPAQSANHTMTLPVPSSIPAPETWVGLIEDDNQRFEKLEPLPEIMLPEPMYDDEEEWVAPAFLRRDMEPLPAIEPAAAPPELPPINHDLMTAAIEAATLIAIDRITEAKDKAASELAAIQPAAVAPVWVPEPNAAITDPRDMVEDQVLYETAMRANNGTVEAIELLSALANKLECSVKDLAVRIIEDRKSRERKIMAAVLARLGE